MALTTQDFDARFNTLLEAMTQLSASQRTLSAKVTELSSQHSAGGQAPPAGIQGFLRQMLSLPRLRLRPLLAHSLLGVHLGLH